VWTLYTAPGPISPSQVDAEEVFHNLKGPRGSPHPERWVPRLEHPALPPRPDLPGWQTPHPGSPLPFLWECALNPFCILYSETGPKITLPVIPADRAQPATYPLITIMEIRDVADETAQFPWPMWATNERGVTVQDVFEAIRNNFSAHVTDEEFESWDERRQARVINAYWYRVDRIRRLYPHRAHETDQIRRVDYMMDRHMFRGLERSQRMDGTWTLFLGAL